MTGGHDHLIAGWMGLLLGEPRWVGAGRKARLLEWLRSIDSLPTGQQDWPCATCEAEPSEPCDHAGRGWPATLSPEPVVVERLTPPPLPKGKPRKPKKRPGQIGLF